ncbi:MAG TPA: dihydroorotate dehydrogenase electron transfer subunit [Candidatus Omnitrophica bacterium]|nr:dihydroorotate dehydrogenase electron transfer subunit [Candidatus Omnitrophota bacterium]
MLHKQVSILNNKEIAPGYFLMELQSPQLASNSSPGQFLHIKCSSNYSPLLRRPLSIHRLLYEDSEAKGVAVLYRVAGKGTSYLSLRKRGQTIDCIGPLGKGFELKNVKNAIIVAGGIGVAPLFFLGERIRKLQITAFLGAKSKDEILCIQELEHLAAEIHIATEDGSTGYKGLVSDLLESKLSTINHQLSTIIYACGPKEMLRKIALLSERYSIPSQVSFEQFMGCGIGVCNACVVATKQGYRKVCRDGPVFWAKEINWERI